MSEGNKTVMPRVCVHCKTAKEEKQLMQLRVDDGALSFCNGIGHFEGKDYCVWLGASYLTHSDKAYAENNDVEIITLAEFKKRIGEPVKKSTPEVIECRSFEVSGVKYDVINDTIANATVESIEAMRDALNLKLKRFRNFKKRVAK